MTLESSTERCKIGAAKFIPSSEAWIVFSKNLYAVLRRLDTDDLLTLQNTENNDWIQIAVQKSNFRIECKSNYYREVQDQLTEDQIKYLIGIGWQSPTRNPDQSTPELDLCGSPNYYLDVPAPLKLKDVQTLIGQTFSEVFKTIHPHELRYEGFCGDGNSLSLPELQLKPLINVQEVEINPELQMLLLSVAQEITSNPNLVRDMDGDIGPIEYKNISAYMRVVEGSMCIRIYSPILMQIAESPSLLAKINDLNCSNGFMHLCHMPNGCVMSVCDVMVVPFITSYVYTALENFVKITSDQATELISVFGGDTTIQPALWN